MLAAHPAPDRYGADLMLLSALSVLRSRGADVTVAVPEDGPLITDLVAEGVDVTVVEFPVLRKDLLRPAAFARLVVGTPVALARLVRRIRDADPDVVYVNTLTLPHWIVAARLARRPVVCHVRESEDRTHSLIQRALTAPLLACSQVITNSHYTAQHLIGRWRRLERNIQIVYNGFVFGQVPPSRRPQHDGELLLVGRLSPRKGQDVAVAALALLHHRGHRPRLRLVGTAFRGYEWYVDELHRAASDLGLEDFVLFDGYRADIAACNAAADIVLVPSRMEPFGNVAVEALAANRPLVTSAVGGLREIVQDGRNGLLVAPEDPESLCNAVMQLLDEPDAAVAMAERGATDVRRRFSIERYGREVDGVIRSVV